MNLSYKRIAAFAMAALMAAGLTACGRGENELEPPDALPGSSDIPLVSPEITAFPSFPLTEASPTPDDCRRSTLYYRTDEGYMIPVSVDVPMEEGIAKACLNRLISTPERRAELQRLGLNPVIPEGTTVDLDISGGAATVNLIGMPKFDSAEDEQMMFMAIVNTLTEFPTVDTVSVYIDGQNEGVPSGGNLPKNQARYVINPENYELATSGNAKPMQLYFPNEEGSLYIPITRYTEGEVDLYACIKALAEGTELKGLRSCFPENTLVLAATIENGVLSVNLSSDFEQITDTVGLYDIASSAVMLTAQQFGGIDEVRFLVNGTQFKP